MQSQSLPTALLRPGHADRVRAGHPWIYESAILRLTREVADGELVQVKDHRQRFLGIGWFNSHSKLRIRLLAEERIEPDQAFFEQRIRAALEVRRRHLPQATSFRLVSSEGDRLSGLVVDQYEDVLVVQTASYGMDQRKKMITSALDAVVSPRAILERNDTAARRFEGLTDVQGVLKGPDITRQIIHLNGIQFEVDLTAGHKTGLYLDQQLNYQAIAPLVRGRRVLDCFCFQGGFALHAARAGAVWTHGLDQSAEAIRAAERNASANGLTSQCTFETANVFDWLKHQPPTAADANAPYDAIILDPPSFTRTRAAVPDALRGYKEIHLRALRLLAPGGTLITFCCSHHVDAVAFQEVVLAAAFDARRLLRRIASYSQAPDHPILPAIPETEYLKGYAFEVVK